jgi:hypothetical protein
MACEFFSNLLDSLWTRCFRRQAERSVFCFQASTHLVQAGTCPLDGREQRVHGGAGFGGFAGTPVAKATGNMSGTRAEQALSRAPVSA